MRNFSTFILALAVLPAFAGGGGGGGLTCDSPVTETSMGNGTGSNPTSNCINGPGYYVGSDIDGDGCEDVDYSIENYRIYSFTPPAGTGCATWDMTISPDANQSVQSTWFEDTSEPNSCGCSGGYDAGDRVEDGGGVNQDGNPISLSMTICEGQTTTILVDGYAGDADGGYTLNIACQPLAIDLLRFEAYSERRDVLVKWETSSEENVRKFIIQRSSNGHVWKDIGNVDPANEGAKYTFTDKNAPSDYLYYRLMELENDGVRRKTVSQNVRVHHQYDLNDYIRFVHADKSGNTITVALEEMDGQDITIDVMGVNGEMVTTSGVISYQQQVVLETGHLNSGIYMIRLQSNGVESTRKLVIN